MKGGLLPGLFKRHDPVRGSGLTVKNTRIESARVRRSSKSHGFGRVGIGGLQISRFGPGQPNPIRPARGDTTRENKLCFSHTAPTAADDSSPQRARDGVKPSRLHVPLV